MAINPFELARRAISPLPQSVGSALDFGISERLFGGKYDPSRNAFQAATPYGFNPTPEQQRDIASRPELSTVIPNAPGLGSSIPGVNFTPAPPPVAQGVAAPTRPAPIQSAPAPGSRDSRSLGLPEFSNDPVLNEINQGRVAAAQRFGTTREEAEGVASRIIDPIFRSLDQRLGNLAGRRAADEGFISQNVLAQQDIAERERARGIRSLESSQEKEQQKGKRALRDLEQDIRNSLEATQRFLGARGAGDSSATGQASEALSKQALKARGGIMESRDQALAEIELRKQDVNDLAANELSNIERWKSDSLAALGREYNDLRDRLESGLAQADSERARIIQDRLDQADQNLVSRLQQLDDATLNYKSGVTQWAMQRQAAMEDFQTQLAISSQFTGGAQSSASQQNALNFFRQMSSITGPQAAAAIAQSQFPGVDFSSVLQLGEAGVFDEEPDFAEQLKQAKAKEELDQLQNPGVFQRIGNFISGG